MNSPATPQTLSIEKLVYGGDGLSRTDSGIVLTPYVLPGEQVRAEVVRAKNDMARGRLMDVLERAPQRVPPPCEYFGRCGGCHYQHADYPFQAAAKAGILREVLKRVGKIEFDGDIPVITGNPWGYRNRSQLHIQDGKIGYFHPGSHTLLAVNHCPISSPRLNDAIGQLSRDLPHYRFFSTTVELFSNEEMVQAHLTERVPASALELFRGVGTREPIVYEGFRVSAKSFFQINRFLWEALVDTVMSDAAGDDALDLYAGVGLFSRRLARSFSQVIAVESAGDPYRDLEWNIGQGGWAATPQRMNAEEYLTQLGNAPALIIADPPRAGLGRTVTGELLRLRSPDLRIVSCDPATLARDLQTLLSGGYRLENLTVVDLFPQTFHLETVAKLRLAR